MIYIIYIIIQTIFDAEEYYNYNLILNAYFNRQLGRALTYDNIKDKINSVIENEKNEILEEKENILKGIKNFNKFKDSYLNQKRIKKEELKKLFLNGIEDDIKEKKEEIQIEFSSGEIIKEEKNILTKYPNSILAACINNKISLPKRKNSIFLDRNSTHSSSNPRSLIKSLYLKSTSTSPTSNTTFLIIKNSTIII